MATIESKSNALLEKALAAENGRQAKILAKDGPLRQSVIALRAGVTLAEHNSPPAATIFLLKGKLRISGQDEAIVSEGELDVLTHFRHSVEALEDSVFLLTTVTSVAGTDSHAEHAVDGE
ncbi:cupin [Corynebacterium sp. A21]|uniref:cupin n=1 Tax=Corynebacterium sp. A21 TaxID=3457318 RepID=UPI003FD0BE28